jgi:uncharacterized protein
MKARGFDPHRLHLEQFARDGGSLHGRWPLAGFARLLSATVAGGGAPAEIVWAADGEQRRVAGAEPQTWLRLEAGATVALQCQRCLQAVAQPLAVNRALRFVRDEHEAARLDEESEDDVLAPGAWIDLHDLIEDELILALPLVPRHEQCPQPLVPPPQVAELDDDPAEPHPFAALAALQRPKPRH